MTNSKIQSSLLLDLPLEKSEKETAHSFSDRDECRNHLALYLPARHQLVRVTGAAIASCHPHSPRDEHGARTWDVR